MSSGKDVKGGRQALHRVVLYE